MPRRFTTPGVLTPAISGNWIVSSSASVASERISNSSGMSGCIRYTETNSSVSEYGAE